MNNYPIGDEQIKVSYFDGNVSIYRSYFKDNDIILVNYDAQEIRQIELGNNIDAYQLLRDEISTRVPRSQDDYIDCVERVIIRYLGNGDDKNQRMYYLNAIKDKNNGRKFIKISDLAYKNVATSIEKSMLSQNLLLECGIDTTFVISKSIIDGKEVIHAFNLLQYNGKCYLFDSSIPTVKNDKISPIICEISEDIFNDVNTIEVKHLNSLKNKETEVIYNMGKDIIYKNGNEYVKKLV